ncbi:hypothetical protein PIB30_015445 [Stylosanthes scabra]|uniref:RNase H type-1 domain-containing protein n=1 Tax=Stylosanthes scabra TaxID=79078 RepID=A0ABU6U6D5_9FABA|nr:hypothetical protein [Stylosanthes scabra]
MKYLIYMTIVKPRQQQSHVTLQKEKSKSESMKLTSLRSLWHGRNKIIYEGENQLPEVLLQSAVASFSETLPPLYPAASVEHPLGSQSPSFWSPPLSGHYKVNVDASKINGGRGGIGVVVRDTYGLVVAAATLEADSSLSVREAEALAFYPGLNIAAHSCFLEIEAESDNIEVVRAL